MGWSAIRLAIWLHLAIVLSAISLTPVLLWDPCGMRRHRQLGCVGVAAMAISALDSIWIRQTNHGQFSMSHRLSAFTAFGAPRIVLSVRAHDHAGHGQSVHALVISGLLTAGTLTFSFHRLPGRWFLG